MYTESMLEELRGKSIAVVGNAVFQYRFGSFIDNHDVVIRLNGFVLEEYTHLCGTKTTHWCTHGSVFYNPFPTTGREGLVPFSPFQSSAPESIDIISSFRERMVFAQHGYQRDRFPKPSTGISLLLMLETMGIEADVFGFDGFKTGHYFRHEHGHDPNHQPNEFAYLTSESMHRVFLDCMAPLTDIATPEPKARPNAAPEHPSRFSNALMEITGENPMEEQNIWTTPQERIITKVNTSASDYKSLAWAIADRRLSDEECERAIQLAYKYPRAHAEVVGDVVDHRQSYVHKIFLDGDSAWLYEIVLSVAQHENKIHYGFDLDKIERPFEYVEYQPGFGRFKWHDDYSHEGSEAPRKLTVIFQLSDPSDYEGGELQYFGVPITTLPKERGAILVFPAFVPHCVTPVTKGLRKAMVTWIGGPRLR